jgi:protein arginine N-methyltransferase 1
MYLSLVSFEEEREAKVNDYANSLDDWQRFSEEMKSFYNIEMSCLEDRYHQEQADYFVYSGLWSELRPEHVVGQPVVIKRLDLNTCTLEDCEGVDRQAFQLTVPFPSRVSGFAGWFTVDFAGSESSPCSRRVTLSTGPEAGYTHWYMICTVRTRT